MNQRLCKINFPGNGEWEFPGNENSPHISHSNKYFGEFERRIYLFRDILASFDQICAGNEIKQGMALGWAT